MYYLDCVAMKCFPYILRNHKEYFVDFGSESRNDVYD